MNDIAIKVENLSKRYRIGLQEEMHDTLVGAMVDWLKRPAHNFRRLRRLTQFDDNVPVAGDQPSVLAPSSSEAPDIIWALKDVSFEVKRGEVVGIIGRNGAGKSTLLKILSRITHPTSGRIEIDGRVSSLLEVGTGFHPELTGRENIYLNGTILGMTRAEIDRKFDEIVDFSGVEKFIDTPVKFYSSGMGVRLAFSVAAHLEPEILLVDEVLAVGDAEFQKKCLGKMDEVAGEGRTVLFVSHNMATIRQLCETAILFDEGGVEMKGGVDCCIEKYLETSEQRFGTILQHGVKHTDDISISNFQVNNQPNDEISLADTDTELIVDVWGYAHHPVILCQEARIVNLFGENIAVYSPGHMYGLPLPYPIGDFHIHSIIKLPRLTKGRYFISFFLTHPSVKGYWDFPNGLMLEVEGVLTKTGNAFESQRGVGYFVLDGETQYDQ